MPTKIEKKYGRQLLEHADNDCWESCLSMLRNDPRYQQETFEINTSPNAETMEPCQNKQLNEPIKIWLHGSTSFGDYLVHLCAFAACEQSLSLIKRRKACFCLKLILEWEGMKVSQRVANDGGTALHGALASVSSSVYDINEEENNDIKDDANADLKFDEAFPEIHVHPRRQDEIRFVNDPSLNDENLTLVTISMLLDAGADPNTKLVNILSRIDDEEDDEMELTYAREAILQQWNPLIMVLIGMSLTLKNQVIPMETFDIGKELHFKILTTLLEAGADPTYEVGEITTLSPNEDNLWYPIEFAAISLAGCLNKDVMKRDRYECNIWGRVEMLLIEAGSPPLSDVQSFIINILNDNVEGALKLTSKIKEDKSFVGRYKDYCTLSLCEFFPFPGMVFPENGTQYKKSLLELACQFGAFHSIHFLLDCSIKKGKIEISESLCRSAILSLYEFQYNDNNSLALRRENEMSIQEQTCVKIIETCCYKQMQSEGKDIEFAVCKTNVDFMIFRQQFLDKLLLFICATRKTTTVRYFDRKHFLSSFLLQLGSDPNVKSIVDAHVEGKQTPLHIVAGNRHDSEGIALMKLLLSSGSNVNSLNQNELLPIEVGLKCKNNRIVQLLWRHHKRETSIQSLSLETYFSLEFLYKFGVAGIDCYDVEMLTFSVETMYRRRKQSSVVTEELISNYLGEFLLRIIDPRSGFTSIDDESNYMIAMQTAVFQVLLNSSSIHSNLESYFINSQWLPTFVKSEVSQMNVFHFLLSQERFMAKELRKRLFRPLCEWAKAIEWKSEKRDTNNNSQGIKNVSKSKFLSVPCHNNFGKYTPLHMACAIGCHESIDILVEFGADLKAIDLEGNTPYDLIENSDLKEMYEDLFAGTNQI